MTDDQFKELKRRLDEIDQKQSASNVRLSALESGIAALGGEVAALRTDVTADIADLRSSLDKIAADATRNSTIVDVMHEELQRTRGRIRTLEKAGNRP